ncbi:MAG: haloacid dehalogenase type II [Streptosporangiales bacterium]
MRGREPMMAVRPHAVAFDVVETLMSLEPLRGRLVHLGQPGHLLETWFARLLRDGIALSATGDYRRFPEVAADALRAVTGYELDGGQASWFLAGFDELPAYPDAEPALRRLHDAGIQVATLTNGTAESTRRFLDRTGLAPLVQQVISCEEVGSWKPPAAVYRHAVDTLATPRERVALVAVHAWDCHGAKRAGLTTGWCSRLERRYGELFAAPDVVGADLVEVVDGLLALPEG